MYSSSPQGIQPVATKGLTELLAAHGDGDEEALDQAFELIYSELRKLARFRLQRQPSNTLNTTALVNELYIKISDGQPQAVADRGHLLALASRAMRQIVVDHARIRCAEKRGGGVRAQTFEEQAVPVADEAEWILTLDRVLYELRERNERMEQIFQCRYFAGLTEEETATALSVSVSTVQRDWHDAKAWLRDKLE